MPVKAEDISFVMQGPVRPETAEALASIRRLFPGSEIILSTWAGVDASGLDLDLLVENPDPGRFPWQFNENINRLIASTHGGLVAATRPYAAKVRSDCILTGDGFTRVDVNAVPRHPGYSLFRQRIVCPVRFTRNPMRWPFLLHPSDMFHFGLRTDLLDLWRIPMVRSFLVNKTPRMETSELLVPEQYIFRSFLIGRGIALPPVVKFPAPVEGDAQPEWDAETLRAIEFSNGYLTQNFWVEADEALGLSYGDRGEKGWSHVDTNFTPEEWRRTAWSYAPSGGAERR